MALRGTAVTIQYLAWDTANNVGKTGDVSNHTLRLIQDGTAAAPTNSPAEVDATNCPGVYKLAITAAEMEYNVITLAGKSSTANISISPVIMTTEGNIEGTLNLTEVMRIILAAVAGKTTDSQTKFRDVADTKDRITATLSSGDRTSISLDGS